MKKYRVDVIVNNQEISAYFWHIDQIKAFLEFIEDGAKAYLLKLTDSKIGYKVVGRCK